MKKIILLILFAILLMMISLTAEENDAQKKIRELELKIPKLEGTNKIDALNELGKILENMDMEKALSIDAQALELSKKINYQQGTAKALDNIGSVYTTLRKFDTAMDYLTKSLKISEQINDKTGMADSNHNIGNIYYFKSDYKKAMTYYQRSLQLREETGDKRRMLYTLLCIGNINKNNGNFSESLQYLFKVLKISEEINDNRSKAGAYNNIARVYDEQGKFEKALEYYFLALKLKEEIGDKFSMIITLNNIGETYRTLAKYAQALVYFQKSLKIGEEINNSRSIGDSLNSIGILYYNIEKYDKSLEFLKKSLVYREKSNDKNGKANSLNNIGVIYEQQNKYKKALEFLNQALKIREELGNENGISTSFSNIGIVYEKLGQFASSLQFHNDALKLRNKIGDKIGISSSLKNIGIVLKKMKQFRKAESYFNQSLAISKEIKTKDKIKEIYKDFNELYEAQGDIKKAYQYFKLFYEEEKSIAGTETLKQINELQEKFNSEKREKEIALMKKNEEIQRLQFARERLWRNTLIVTLILVLTILTLIFKRFLYLATFWKKKNHIGHFRIREQIASGGMGVIYKAHDVKDKTSELAIKVLRDEYSTDELNRKRFKNEALIIDQLHHPNIVKIIERGEYSGNLYIAMEMLDGKSLALLMQTEKLPLPIILHIMAQIADALVKIHDKSVIHRDLKPENIMIIEKDGDPYFVKLLDFGLAKTETLTKLTQTGIIMGTINYMAPEQISLHQDSPASDVYSLGVIFYFLLSGEQPFFGESAMEIAIMIMEKQPIQLSKFRSDIPESLCHIIENMLDKDPSARPSSQEVQQAIKICMPNN